MTTPTRPAVFDPEQPPPGIERRLISFWQSRPKIKPRLQLVHTNWASGEGTVDAAYNWANQEGSNHTIPHFQVDRSGRGAMLLPLDRKGIANYQASEFSIAVETADRGLTADPSPRGSEFTPAQAETVALCLAYAAWGYRIPLNYPATWDGNGTACHTEPFGYPHWTNSAAKACPGELKKSQMGTLVLPRARQILAAWTGPAPTPIPEDDVAAPASVMLENGRLDNFVVGADGQLWHNWWEGSQGRWSTWQPLGGHLKSSPAVSGDSLERIDVTAQGVDGFLWHIYWNGKVWSEWEKIAPWPGAA